MQAKRVMYSASRGFTLVELIIVIVVLGLIAATAFSRFSRIDTQAHKSQVGATAGSFRAAVILVRATYVSKGFTGVRTNLPGFGNNDVETSTQGFPTDTAGSTTTTMSTTKCLNVWNGILQNAPSINTSAAANPDYLLTASATTCTYTYRRDTSNTRRFTYAPLNGVVTVTNP